MSDEIKVVSYDQLEIAARCLEANLHNGRAGQIHGILCDVLDGKPHPHILTAVQHEKRWVGCITFNRKTRVIHVFVDSAYRRKGVGRKLISALLERLGLTPGKLKAIPDDDGAELFFDKLHIPSHRDLHLSVEETHAILSGTLTIARLRSQRRKQRLAQHSQ
jgi:GNAT superfamily N-acetyltransferase